MLGSLLPPPSKTEPPPPVKEFRVTKRLRKFSTAWAKFQPDAIFSSWKNKFPAGGAIMTRPPSAHRQSWNSRCSTGYCPTFTR
jgi:hypothetical protein